MKAWVLHGIGDIQYEEVKEPQSAGDEVIMKVMSVGICGSDIPRIYKTGTYHFPTIPGHEFSGIVADVGAGVNPKWKNKRVGVFPLIPCHVCASCKKGQYEMCRNYGYLGSRQNGGFAEYAAVPVKNLIELPDSVSMQEAAMLEPMAVAVHAMRRARPMTGDRIVVCGLGTIGMLLVSFLRETGIRDIFVIGNKAFQRITILKTGLQENCYCDSRVQDVEKWLMERTEGKGADVFFECVGRNETISQAVNLTAPGGSVCLVGNPGSDMTLEREVYWKILRNQLTITGTWNSSFTHEIEDDWHYVLDRLEQGKISPGDLISHKFPLKNLESGLHIMRDKTQDYIKIMAEINV